MKMRRTIVAVLTASMTAGLGTAAAIPAAADDTKTIYIYQMKTEIQDALEQVCEKYSESHPGVVFKCESASDNYSTSLKTKFQGGDAPDVFSVSGHSDVLTWQSQLADLTGEDFTKTMIDTSAENVTVDGKVLGFPLSVEGCGYVYNTELFKKAGITEVPTTKEALSDDVKKLADSGVAEPITECYMDWYQLGNFMINLGFAGQDDPQAFIKGLADGSASFVGNDVWELLADYIQFEYNLDTNPSTTDFNTQTALVGSQDLAITIGGNWSQPTYDAVDPNLPVSLMGIPFSDDEKKNDRLYLVGTYWGVNKDSKNLDTIKDFLNWLVTDPDGQGSIAKTMQLIPAYSNIDTDTDSIGALGQAVEEYIKAGKVGNIYYTYFPDGFAQAAGEAVQKFGAGKSTKDEFLQELQDKWTNLSAS